MELAEIHNKRVFLSPLDWGLGHCARLIPIINQLVEQNCTLFIGVNEEQRVFFNQEKLKINLLDFCGYEFKIPKKNWEWNFVLQSPKLLKKIQQETEALSLLQEKYNFEMVISDHRYGCRITGITNIFLTHQLTIPGKFLKRQVNNMHRKYMNHFDFIWVYDDDRNLAGALSSSQSDPNTHYIGVKSRFVSEDLPLKFDVLVIVSGPEPHRSNFRSRLLEELKDSNLDIAFLGAELNRSGNDTQFKNVHYLHHASTYEINKLINQSRLIVSRCGYTTLMDLATVNKNAILCPTPGQGEQEYLYNFHRNTSNKIKLVREEEISIELIETILSQG